MRETAGDCWDTQPLVWLSTAMGPLFTFALMWMGLFLLKTLSTRKKMLGFVLVSGNLPLARILTVALGGGGELVVYRILFPALDFDELRLLGVTVDLFFIIPPMVAAMHFMQGKLWQKLLLTTLLMMGP